jgi:hypothetical protein
MEQFIDTWKEYLTESSLTRLYDHMMEHESAVLTAFRNEYSTKENNERNRKLKARLLMEPGDFGVTKVDGSYIENFDTPAQVEVSERSFFVSNRGDTTDFVQRMAEMAEDFEQDSVLIIPRGAEGAYLIGTSYDNDFPPYGEEIDVGNLKMGEDAEFMSKVKGRPFVFKEELQTYAKLSRNSRWALKKMLEEK